MPRDRVTIIGIALAVLGFAVCFFWQQEELKKVEKARRIVAAQATPLPSATPSPTPVAQVAPPPTAAPQSDVPEEKSVLRTGTAELEADNNHGGLVAIRLLQHKGENDQPIVLGSGRTAALGAYTEQPALDWVDSGYQLNSDPNGTKISLVRQIADQVTLTKVFETAKSAGLKDEYQFKFTVTFQNSAPTEYQNRGFFLSTGSAQPVHQNDQPRYLAFGWYKDSKFTAADVGSFKPQSFFGLFQTNPGHATYAQQAEHILWAGVYNQYFMSVVQPSDKNATQVWAAPQPVTVPITGAETNAIVGAIGMPGFKLAPGETKTLEFVVYAGPKEYGRLSKLPGDLAAVLNFGWFTPISEGLLTAMNTIHAFIPSYAAAIIIITLLIRSALWPLQNYTTKSMRRMSKLSPLMTELRTKYKDDPQRLNTEMMKLYKEHKINPLSGCLPMLIQIPIFFGFYNMLGSAVELRNSPFLWVHDLSQPDTVAHLFGIPINILPLVMAGTQVWQMQITPKTGDPSQQRMLMIMPMIFLVFCYGFASALSLYYSVQSLFLIVQTYLTRNQTQPETAPAPRLAPVAKKKTRI